MIPVEFFARQRLMYPVRNLLNPQEISDLLQEMQTSPAKEAVVFEKPETQGYYPLAGQEKTNHRKTREIWVSEACRNFMHEKLMVLLPELNAYYQRQAKMLNRWEMLQFLKYETGDFFRPHQDWNPTIIVENIPPRLISFTLFLNLPESLAPEDNSLPSYHGGELEFYLPHAKLPGKLGLALRPEQGMLVSFLPEVVHGVKPVLSGERYTVVGWFQ